MKDKIKLILKNNENLLRFAALLYNVAYFNLPLVGMFHGVFIKKTKFKIKGNNCKLICGPKTRLTNCLFYLNGNNTTIQIGENCILDNLELWIEDDNGAIYIGENTTVEGGHFAATEGKKIIVGNDCMFSSGIQIRNGDSHAIFEIDTNDRINEANDVIIGNHVWLGANVVVLKGSEIADNCIGGTGAIMSGKYLKENAIYVGIPAKKVRDNIYWKRER